MAPGPLQNLWSAPGCGMNSRIFIICSILPALAAAEDEKPEEPPAPPSPGHSQHGEIFNEGPRQAAVLIGNTGKIDFEITTKSPEAQKFFNQGVGQLHGFWYLESERSFRQVAAIDPDCAMAYWGMAMANFRNKTRATGFIEEATKRKESASEREQKWIDSLAKFFEEGKSDDKPRRRALVRALENIVLEYPDELEAKAFLMLQIYSNNGKGLSIPSHYAINLLISQILEENPAHPVHHYRIHLWDSEKPAQALASAAGCGPAAPAIAHMWHMPGHIYSKLHRYEDAVWQQEASARVDHAHMTRFRLIPDQISNFAHNNEWLIRNLNYLGQADRAVELACNMIELPRLPKLNSEQKYSGGGSWDYGRQRLRDTLMRYEKWEELIAYGNTDYLKPGTGRVDETEWRRFMSIASFESGDRERGQQLLAELEKDLEKVKADQEAAVKKVEEANAVKKDDEKEKAEVSCEDKKDDEKKKAEKSNEDKKDDEKKKTEEAGEDKKDDEKKKVEESGEDKKDDEKKKAEEPKKGKTAAEIKKLVDAERRKFKTKIDTRTKAIKELKAYDLVFADEPKVEEAGKAVDGATGIAKIRKARLFLKLGDVEKALKLATEDAASGKNQIHPLATKVHMLLEADKKDEAKTEFEKLRKMAHSADLDLPVFERLAPLTKGDWQIAKEPAKDLGERPDLAKLGPFRWQPPKAPGFTLKSSDGKPVSLADYAGKPTLVIFFLGRGCTHCMEQLTEFAPMKEKFAEAGIEILAVSTDTVEGLKLTYWLNSDEEDKEKAENPFPFPLLSDSDLKAFRDFRAYDDFEEMALHGTFLIDQVGRIRWQNISFEPFMKPEFMLEESVRLLSYEDS
ncbi:MAG: peroxiredoxin [Verrucomicrobiales bacterium]|jgi:peroxiredoxin